MGRRGNDNCGNRGIDAMTTVEIGATKIVEIGLKVETISTFGKISTMVTIVMIIKGVTMGSTKIFS